MRSVGREPGRRLVALNSIRTVALDNVSLRLHCEAGAGWQRR
jgi:hypothetical protein